MRKKENNHLVLLLWRDFFRKYNVLLERSLWLASFCSLLQDDVRWGDFFRKSFLDSTHKVQIFHNFLSLIIFVFDSYSSFLARFSSLDE